MFTTYADAKKLNKEDVPRVKNPQMPIVLDGLNCQGSEASLAECGRRSVVEYCVHYSNSNDGSDAGASCTNVRGERSTDNVY